MAVPVRAKGSFTSQPLREMAGTTGDPLVLDPNEKTFHYGDILGSRPRLKRGIGYGYPSVNHALADYVCHFKLLFRTQLCPDLLKDA